MGSELPMEGLLQVLHGAGALDAARGRARRADLLRRRHVHAHYAHRLRRQHHIVALRTAGMLSEPCWGSDDEFAYS